jgi:hypothetical protein
MAKSIQFISGYEIRIQRNVPKLLADDLRQPNELDLLHASSLKISILCGLALIVLTFLFISLL